MEPMIQLVNSQYIPDDLKLIHMNCLFKFSDYIYRETLTLNVLVTASIGVLLILIIQFISKVGMADSLVVKFSLNSQLLLSLQK